MTHVMILYVFSGLNYNVIYIYMTHIEMFFLMF